MDSPLNISSPSPDPHQAQPKDSAHQRRVAPRQREAEQLPCPRCHSTNTKFCYYNNYNLAQPRHFCKSCRRYWTRGGTLRNIPFGGGTRNKPTTAADGVMGQITQARAVVQGSGSMQGIESCLQSGSGSGFLPFSFYGTGMIRPVVGYEPCVLYWPMEQASGGGDGGAHMASPPLWQMGGGGGAEGEGDYFSWPELAISTPAAKAFLK